MLFISDEKMQKLRSGSRKKFEASICLFLSHNYPDYVIGYSDKEISQFVNQSVSLFLSYDIISENSIARSILVFAFFSLSFDDILGEQTWIEQILKEENLSEKEKVEKLESIFY